MKILIVEDEETQRIALFENLAKEGFSPFAVKNGVDGLTIALREHPDLILLDIRMPKMDGMTMMHKLREDAWGKKVPIIILTNYDPNEAQISQMYIDLPSSYLIKSNSSLEKIVGKIKEVLDSKKNEKNPPLK